MQTIASNQASAEVPINENFALLGWAAVYGKRAEASSGLTWAYEGGRWGGFAVTAATLTLTNAADNYIVVAIATGVISTSTATTNWNDATNYARVYKVTTAGGVVTATEDHRAGTGGVIVSISGGGGGREMLTANRTYYVATTGSDSNNGLTVGSPFLTLQKAVDVACGLDMAIYGCTIAISDGTYTGATVLKSYLGAGPITIQGNAATPANVLLNCSATVFYASGVVGAYTIKDLKAQTTLGCVIDATGTTTIISFGNLVFGAVQANQIAASSGATISAISNYAISGGSSAGAHAYAICGGVITISVRTVTITGTPAFAAAFAWADRGLGMIDAYGMTFSGTATGKRYTISNNSVCFVNGAATTYFPGNVAGTTATGGQYA